MGREHRLLRYRSSTSLLAAATRIDGSLWLINALTCEMHPLQILEQLRRRPIVWFRLHLADGPHDDVSHREFAVVTT